MARAYRLGSRNTTKSRRTFTLIVLFCFVGVVVLLYQGTSISEVHITDTSIALSIRNVKGSSGRNTNPASSKRYVDKAHEEVKVLENYILAEESIHLVDEDVFGGLEVVIYEEDIHDEVVGAIGKALVDIGVTPIFNCQFRFDFSVVLQDVIQAKPIIEFPHGENRAIDKRIRENSIDVLILTTCWSSLKRMKKEILAGTAHVVCFWHNGGVGLESHHKSLVRELAEQGRISFVVIAKHVERLWQTTVDEWTEVEQDATWDSMPVELFAPVFDWPAETTTRRPDVWPTTVMIQGNLDPFRRAYYRIFDELIERISDDPAEWGYRHGGADEPFEPISGSQPFRLQLMGQPVPEGDLKIPVELSSVVSVHQKLKYPDYYRLLSSADLLLPAFYQRGYYEDTASSSVAAGIIGRVSVLGSRRLWEGYDYLDAPALVKKNVSTSEISAIADLRRRNDWEPPVEGEWEAFFEKIAVRNSIAWAKIMRSGGAGHFAPSNSTAESESVMRQLP